jgi:transcriptional regulator GlxA family with amidase domain
MDRRVQNVISLLSSDLRRGLSTIKAAGYAELSVSRFRHLFKTETGTSIGRYLKILRLQEAKELIGTTSLSIKEVMAQVGVKDKSNFARDFRKAYGFSPVQYRRNAQRKEDEVDDDMEAVFTNK